MVNFRRKNGSGKSHVFSAPGLTDIPRLPVRIETGAAAPLFNVLRKKPDPAKILWCAIKVRVPVA